MAKLALLRPGQYHQFRRYYCSSIELKNRNKICICLNGSEKVELVSCDKISPEETHRLTPDRDSNADQSTDTTKVQLSEPKNFIGVTYRSMGEGLLTRAKMTQRQLHYQSPPQHR